MTVPGMPGMKPTSKVDRESFARLSNAEAEATSYHKYWIDERNKRIAAEAENAALRKENFAFSAGLCPTGYGDEYGHFRCKEQDDLRAQLAAAEATMGKRLATTARGVSWVLTAFAIALAVLPALLSEALDAWARNHLQRSKRSCNT